LAVCFLTTGIKIENKELIDTLSNIRQSYILSPNKQKKLGFEAEKVLEKMNSKEQKIWNALKNIF